MSKILKYLRPYKWPVTMVILMTVVQSLGQLYLPDLMADIVNKGVVSKDISLIVQTGLIMLGFSLVITVCTVAGRYYGAKASTGFARDLRRDIFKKVSNFSLNEFDKIGTASLITRSTNDVTQVQNAVLMMLVMLLAAPIMCVGGIIMAINADPGMSWLIIVSIAVMALIVLVVIIKALPLFKSLQQKVDHVNLVLRENLTGIRVIRAFNKTGFEHKRFDKVNRDLTDTSVKVYRWMGAMMPGIMVALNVASVAVIWFGGLRIDAGKIQVGDMLAFQQYVIQVMFAVIMATMMFVMLPRASASAERINEILDMPSTIEDTVTTVPQTTQRGCVEFKNVSFAYQGAGAPVLSDISFASEPGQVTAIIGGTGSGKSTLVKLIPRFYDVTEGQVLVDGVDVRDYPQAALREKIGFVPQKAVLVSGTVADNLRFGKPDATHAQIKGALKTAQADAFVSALEGGIEAEVAQDGTNFSGGQKQRLSIARALVRKPEIYIFDDSFSALDYKTDAELRKALANEVTDATVIIVAQRVSTVMNADNILVLDEGRVVGQGTHKELLKSCDTYREIVESQLSMEELA